MAFPLFDLAGRRALVTGSSQGIGLALAEGLAAHGAAVVLNGRNEAKLLAAAERIAGAATAAFDVTEPEAATAGVAAVLERGSIDILVNNAGMQFHTPLEDFPVEKKSGRSS
jgi:gluconate 5-dehydrogenase